MNNNPTPGNKAGGLTTILEKSLGAVAKGGSTALNGVYRYAEPMIAKVFVFMDTPGYDPCRRPDRLRAARICSVSPPDAALLTAANPRPRSSSQPKRHLPQDAGRHGHQLRRRLSTGCRSPRRARKSLTRSLRSFRRTDQVGAPGLRRRRIHALADRSNDVTGGADRLSGLS